MLYSFTSACILTFITSLFFSLLVFYKNPQSKINVLWGLMGLSVALWALGLGLMASSPTKEWATFFLRYVHYLGALMIPAFFFHFVLALLELEKSKKLLILFSYTTAFVLQIANFTGYLAYVEPTSYFNFYTRPGPAYNVFSAFFFIAVSYTIFLLFKHYKKATGIKRNQIGYLYASMVIGFAGGSMAFFPVYNIPIFPFGMYFMFLHIPIMSYAIIKHQLMGIDLLLKKSLIYLLLLAFTAIPVYLVILVVTALPLPLTAKAIALAVFILILGFLILKLQIRAELKIENILFGKRLDYRRALRDLQNAFVSKLELDDLLKTIVTTLGKTLDAREVAIFLKQPDSYFQIAFCLGEKCKKHKNMKVPASSPSLAYLSQHQRAIQPEEYKHYLKVHHCDYELDFFNSIDLKLFIPIRSASGLIAFLALGDVRTHFEFSPQDQELFSRLSTEIGIAIENAKAYTIIAELNTNLEHKVKERTQELQKTLEELKAAQNQIIRSGKLAGIGSLAAGIAHEINNALNGALNCAFALDRDLRAVLNKKTSFDDITDDVSTSLDIIRNQMNRTRNIVDQLMKFSRKNAEGFKPDKIHEGINSAIVLLENELKVRNIKVDSNFCDTNEVYCNLSELNQVFFNILLNSIQAIEKKGEITIKTWTQGKEFYISITDTGRGIKPEDIDQIFDPFFTTKPVGTGTGLGLSTSYNIVRDHGGEFEVKSELGQGTEIILRLPLKNELKNAM